MFVLLSKRLYVKSAYFFVRHGTEQCETDINPNKIIALFVLRLEGNA